MPARIPMMATTTSSSINVKAPECHLSFKRSVLRTGTQRRGYIGNNQPVLARERVMATLYLRRDRSDVKADKASRFFVPGGTTTANLSKSGLHRNAGS